MSWLVIGSNSFSGAGFIDHLLECGEEVLGVSRSKEIEPVFRIYNWRNHPGKFAFRQLDLNHDLDQLEDILLKTKPRFIVNFAAQSMVGESWDSPVDWMTTNVTSFVRLLEILRRVGGFERYVHISTPEVYGSVSGWVAEDHPFNPSTPYAVSRAAGDMALSAWHKAYGIPYVATRAANVYGAGQQLYRIIPRTVLYALTDQRLQLHGGGHSERSFVDIRDVSTATKAIAERGVDGGTYHISTTQRISILKLVEMVLDQLNKGFEESVDIVGDRLGKDQSYQLDSKRIRNEISWEEKIQLEQGIEDVISWARDNLEDLNVSPQHYIHKP